MQLILIAEFEGVFHTNARTDKEGNDIPAKAIAQFRGFRPLKNGERRRENIDINVTKMPGKFDHAPGTIVALPVGVFADKGNLRYFLIDPEFNGDERTAVEVLMSDDRGNGGLGA